MTTYPETSTFQGWHLKKEIQLGHIITTLTVAVSAVWYIGKLEQRIALLEAATAQQHERDQRQDESTAEALRLLRSQLERIDSKLDRIIDRTVSAAGGKT